MTALAPPPVVGGRLRPVMGLRRNAVEYAESTWREHGDLVRMLIGPPGMDREVWWLHHPDAAARVLSGSSWRGYSKQDQVHEEISRWLGPGLLTAEGEEWTRQKRFLQPVFTKVAVDGYADLMVEEIEAVVGEWDVADRPVVDLGRQMQRLTLRVVLRALFGDAADDVIPHVNRSFPAVSDTIMRRGLGAVRLPASVPTPRVRRGRAARDDLFGVCEEIVAARREGRTSGETDLLSRLLAARDGDERLTDEEVRGQVLVFMLAGHETTSTALTFALHLLGRHQDVQDRVRAEVRQVLGDDRPTAATTASLPETTAALKEAMRLYPSAPILGRLSVGDDELMGHPVPVGTNVVVVPWTIHRHPDFWADPLVFDPSRFTGSGERPEPSHRYAWMPFGGGPRGCIGQHFSMVEAVLALALVLRGHRVTAVAHGDRVPVASLITLFPTEPVLSRVEPLSR
ncbi:cytochrome P450 [Oryzobacter telluris]|uniref:cytochrome P450 n=1 Tax=Oryzobacter telluris TaxID=3149179 RepID=UPI00370D3C57